MSAPVTAVPVPIALGIAWHVQGAWQTDGDTKPITTAEALVPGSLLRPSPGAGIHSIVVLLPDGQRVLYECFLPQDCDRAFRVPRLNREPDPFAVEFLSRVRTSLAADQKELSDIAGLNGRLARDEALVTLDSVNRVQIRGLAASLSNGRYTYDLESIQHDHPRQPRREFEKNGDSVEIAVPGPGLYDIHIFDELNTPRIDLFLAAVTPEQAYGLEAPYRKAKGLLADWNEDYQGWPVHDLQRAYLKSIILNLKLVGPRGEAAPSEKALPGDVTAEPVFSPNPGVLKGDTAVTLQCATPGAMIYFTLNGSQPMRSSFVYHAPIMVKRTGLTIKAFAIAPGRKDSPVVTGIFRIEQ